MIKSVKVFPFSFRTMVFFFPSKKSNSWHNVAKWLPSDTTPWTQLGIVTSFLGGIIELRTVEDMGEGGVKKL